MHWDIFLPDMNYAGCNIESNIQVLVLFNRVVGVVIRNCCRYTTVGGNCEGMSDER